MTTISINSKGPADIQITKLVILESCKLANVPVTILGKFSA